MSAISDLRQGRIPLAEHDRRETMDVLARLQTLPATSGKRSLDEEKDWATFCRLHHPCLRRLGAQLGLRPDQIEDVIQTVFVDILEHWKEYKRYPVMALLAVTCKEMRHRAVDELRRGDRHCAEPLNVEADDLLDGGVSEGTLRAEAAEWHEWLEARLKVLEGEYPMYGALLRAYLQGRSREEMAVDKGCSVEAIKCSLKRALRLLRRLAEKHPPGGGPPP